MGRWNIILKRDFPEYTDLIQFRFVWGKDKIKFKIGVIEIHESLRYLDDDDIIRFIIGCAIVIVNNNFRIYHCKYRQRYYGYKYKLMY